MAAEWGLSFPVCHDESQETAKSYAAACTPDLYLFDEDRRLVYRGQLDDSRPGNNKLVTGADLRARLKRCWLAGRSILIRNPVSGATSSGDGETNRPTTPLRRVLASQYVQRSAFGA